MKPTELVNRQWILARVPDGPARESDFAQRAVGVAELADGEALGRTRWLTFEAAMRAWLAPPTPRDGAGGVVPARGYLFRVQPGQVMAGQALAGWLASGELTCRPEVHEGFENAPRTFLRLFNGQGTGKQLLRL